MKPLRDAFVASVTHPGKYGDLHGLILRVTSSGSKQWIWRGTVLGKRRDLGLGGYPYVTLAQARAKAFEYRQCAREGGDPSLIRSEIPTFTEAAAKKIAELRRIWKPGGKSEDQWRASLATYALSVIGHIRVDQITAKHVRDCVQSIWYEKPVTAERVLRRIGVILRWAAGNNYRDGDPTRVVKDSLGNNIRPPRHHCSLDHRMVGDAILKIRASNAYPTLRLAFEFSILTMVRSGTVCGARWSEIDLDNRLWKVPADRMKGTKAKARPHVVWLSNQALDILKRAAEFRNRTGLVFPRRDGREFRSYQLSHLATKVELGGTLHGMRRSFRQWARKAGISREMAEDCLSHEIRNRAEKAYAQADESEGPREAMEPWCEYIQRQLDSHP